MYTSLKVDLQKKKKQALRRLSQGGSRKLTPQSGKLVTRRVSGGRGAAVKVKSSQSRNPFLTASSTSERSSHATTSQAPPLSNNPFHSAINQQTQSEKPPSSAANVSQPSKNPFLSAISQQVQSDLPPPPPPAVTSYAAVVAGGLYRPSASLKSAEQTRMGVGMGMFGETEGTTGGQVRMGVVSQVPVSSPPREGTGGDMGGAMTGHAPPPYAGNVAPGGRPPPPSYGARAVMQNPSGSGTGNDNSFLRARPKAAAPSTSSTSLHLKGLPPQLNNPDFLKQHFGRFGQVRVKCYATKMCATIAFKTHEAAIRAKKEGKWLSPDMPPLKIFWYHDRSSSQQPSTFQPSMMPLQQQQQQQQQQMVSHPPQYRQVAQISLSQAAQQEGEDGSEEYTDMGGQEENSSSPWVGPSQDQEPEDSDPYSATPQAFQQIRASREQLVWEPNQQQQRKQQQQQQQQKRQQKQKTEQKKKGSIFDRLGGKVGETSSREEEEEEEEEEREAVRPPTKKTVKRKLPVYDGEEWLPSSEQPTEEEEEDDEGVDVGGAREGTPEGKRRAISKAVLKDLGNKSTGDEMDTIARMAHHGYYLRSLDQVQGHPGLEGFTASPAAPPLPLPPHTLPPQGAIATTCPYDLPRPNLPAPPTPKGTSAGDYYEALDARDQAIRKGMKKQTSLMEARAIVGTCPDMCPEKERYRRQDTHRLSYFEISSDSEPRNAKVDHARAVKEYSGSAADKEEPLPHDLRPLGVLQMTMDYLVTSVMDAGASRPSDWYDFLWNRTRGIRKDITIQHISCPESAELTEKCARFHILCAHHLCGEDITIFDPKLNNENLNKCLLSLKQFYRDIRLGQGILCLNEAEFCCYEILLHLSDGDVLNVIQEYSPSIRQEPPVTLAVQVAFAFKENNFIRFFKLLRSTTFLNACILHRYFPLVRTSALRALNRSHSMQKHSTPFPIHVVKRMLAFPDDSHTIAFCELFELEIKMSKSSPVVSFDRHKTEAITMEDKTIPIEISRHLILSKNKLSLGEVVNGGPLPPRYYHTPHCSFTTATFVEGVDSGEREVPIPPPTAGVYGDGEVLVVLRELLEGGVRELCAEVTRESIQEAEEAELAHSLQAHLEDCVAVFCEEVVLEVSIWESRAVVQEAMEEANLLHCLLHALATQEGESLVESVILESVAATARECVIECVAMETVGREVCEEVLDGVVREEGRMVVREALTQAKQRRKEELEALRLTLQHRQLHKLWNRWRGMVQMKQHYQRCAESIPPCPLLSLPQQLESLLPLRRRRQFWTVGSEEGVDGGQVEATAVNLERRRKEFFSSLHLPVLLREQLLVSRVPPPLDSLPSPSHHASPPDVHCKLVFLYPGREEMGMADAEAVYWICCKLSSHNPSPPLRCDLGGDRGMVSLCTSSTPMFDHPEESQGHTSRQLMLSVRGVSPSGSGWGLLGEEQQKLAMQGTCSLIMFVPAPLDMAPQVCITSLLHPVLEALGSAESKLPLLVIYSLELEENYLAFWFRFMRGLESYCHQSEAISEIVWLKLDTAVLASNSYPQSMVAQLSEALQKLLMSAPPQPSLFHAPVKEYVEQGLLKHFNSLVLADSCKRQQCRLPSQPLEPLVALYNAVVDHLISRALDPRLGHLPWPPPEFAPPFKFAASSLPPLHWNIPPYMDMVRRSLTRLLMPREFGLMEGGGREGEEEGEWSFQCSKCQRFVAALASLGGEKEDQSKILLFSRVKTIILQHLSRQGKREPRWMPWDQIVLACVDHLLTSADSDLWVTVFADPSVGGAMVLPVEWLRAQADTALLSAQFPAEGAPSTDHTSSTPARGRKRHFSGLDTGTLSDCHRSPVLANVDVATPPGFQELARKLERLQHTVQEEKQSTLKFEEQLRQWMLGSTPNPQPHPLPWPVLADPQDTRAFYERRDEEDTTDGEESLAGKINSLSRTVRAARLQGVMDTVYLHSLVNDYPLD